MRPPSACEVAHVPVEMMDQTLPGTSAYPDFSQEQGIQEEGVYVFPASLEQIRYWTLDQLDGDSTASNMAIAARLEGEVKDALVERAIQAIVERHEALRTTFRLVDDRLCQIITDDARYSFSVTDLRSLPDAERAQAAEAAVEEHTHARADLATGPAFFVRLIHLTDQLHFLAFTMHHIVCDGWSNGILIRDFTDFYAAFAQNREPALPELPFQFADFTVWQQNWLASDAAKAAVNYWQTHIRRDMPAVDLPKDSPRQPQKSYPGQIESTLLGADLTTRLKAYCRAHNATMHQVLLAAFEALVARYANQNEFLLGSTIANRTQPGMENVVGRFANPQVILADVSGDPTYAQLLRRVSEWSTESYSHQDLPFSRLMEEFQLDQAGATSQFLQVYFVYQKAFMQPQEAGDLKVIPRPSVSGGVNFDLLVSIVERAEGPRLQMEYNTVLFRKERIVSLIAMYVRVLEAVMSDDSLNVSQLPLGAPAAAMQEDAVLSNIGVNGVAALVQPADVATGVSLAEWLDQQAELLGDTAAVISGDNRLSWNALQKQSYAFSNALVASGVRAGETVALRLESNANTAAAAWALLRIGATVLPLPASSSAAEWTQLLAAHRPALALASADFAATVPGVTSFEQLVGTIAGNANAASPLSALNAYPDPSSVAWVGLNRRSGELAGELAGGAAGSEFTLLPASHQATLQQLRAAVNALDIRNADTILVNPVESATDGWVDLLLPLTAGATLVYPGLASSGLPQSGTASSQSLKALQPLLAQHAVSFVFTSTSSLLSAVQDRWTGDRRLNVVLRGSNLSPAQAQRLSLTPLRLWSLVSSAHTAGPLAIAKVAGAVQPVFIALAGKRLVILDDNDQPVPAGVSGELAAVSNAGYSRIGLLAQIPAGSPSGATDGGFQILDTVERLVRLHGYRLRLSELEEVLWQSPAVADTVAAILTVDGTPALVSYFQSYEPAVDTARVVRNHFKTTAPGHLAAAELIAVPVIPRLADGSPDFAKLPPPGSTKSLDTVTDEYVPPRDELEASLVAIWEEVLGIRPIGIRTPFFKLGGYSLMIVRLFARINKVLGKTLPITTIFNAPTVEQLADIVRGRAYYSSLVPVNTEGTKPPFFMMHSYLLYQGIPRVLGTDFPFYGLRELDTDAEDMTVDQRAAAYLDAMRAIQPQGPYYIGGWCAAGPLAVETARQITASGEEVGFLVLFDSWRPGYAAELARQQAGTAERSLRARLGRKYRFHRNRLRPLSAWQRVNYFTAAIGAKFASVRNRLYLKNWAIAEWFCHKFGLSLPHFMHNVSLTTLNSLKEYRGIEPYTGSMVLIRAKEAPYIPGAEEHCGWDAIVKGGVKVQWASGDHESMFLDPHLQEVGQLLHEGLADAYAAIEAQRGSVQA